MSNTPTSVRSRMYVATESFFAHDRYEPIIRAVTMVAEDSDLYRRFPQCFRAADETQSRGLEQATAAPGEAKDVT